jgi:hypothetical protein
MGRDSISISTAEAGAMIPAVNESGRCFFTWNARNEVVQRFSAHSTLK